MDKVTLEYVRDWAQSRVDSGSEPPWTYHKLKEVAKLASELSAGIDVTVSKTDSLQSQEHQETVLPLGENIFRLENARFRRDLLENLQMPT